jgi:hypothetical protein
MSVRLVSGVVSLLALAGLAFGSGPVATVTSPGTFNLHGSTVRTEGIPSWPVMADDEIATFGFPALIRLQDGTSVALGENSRAKVETVDNVLVFRLLGGTMHVIGAPSSGVRIYNGTQPVVGRSSSSSGTGVVARPARIIAAPPPPAPVSGQ